MLKDILQYTVEQLVELPDAVTITLISGDNKEIYEIKVDSRDVGKIIGKEGQTIRALRILANAVVPHGKEIEVTVAK